MANVECYPDCIEGQPTCGCVHRRRAEDAERRVAELEAALRKIRDDPGISEWDGWRNVGRLHDIARAALDSAPSQPFLHAPVSIESLVDEDELAILLEEGSFFGIEFLGENIKIYHKVGDGEWTIFKTINKSP